MNTTFKTAVAGFVAAAALSGAAFAGDGAGQTMDMNAINSAMTKQLGQLSDIVVATAETRIAGSFNQPELRFAATDNRLGDNDDSGVVLASADLDR